MSKISPLMKQKKWMLRQRGENVSLCYYLWQIKMNILMTLRVSWGIQLMSTSFIPTVPFSIFTESLFFYNTQVKHIMFNLSNPIQSILFEDITFTCKIYLITFVLVITNQNDNKYIWMKINTYRPWIQDLVYSKQHQGNQSNQEDVHEHPAHKTKWIFAFYLNISSNQEQFLSLN